MKSKTKINCTVVIVGIVKDVANSIHDDFLRLTDATSIFSGVKWFLVESNSIDNSLLALDEIKKENSNFDYVSIGNSNSSSESRTIGMGIARNRYLQELRENINYNDAEYIIVADFNNLNNLISEKSIASCFERSDWDACFANQTKRYYDIWALRHPLWSPNDCWEQLNFLRKYWKFPELALYASVQSRMIHIPADSEWIEVDSAFGGFAIYKRNVLLSAQYSGTTNEGAPICEHVPFNLALSHFGYRLFVNPALINTGLTDHTENTLLHSIFRRIIKYPRKLWKKSLNS